MNELTLRTIMKYLRQNNLCESLITLQRQSQVNMCNYGRQIQFFRKIVLLGDFNEAIKFIVTFQSKFDQSNFKKIILELYKQKLYELIENPDENQLKNLFEKQIINYCSQDQYQQYFTYLTCRNVHDIPNLNEWTPIKGRIHCFEEILPYLQQLLLVSPQKTQVDMNLDEIIQEQIHKNISKQYKKRTHQKQSVQSISYKPHKQQLNQSSVSKNKSKYNMTKSKAQAKQTSMQLSQSKIQKSQAFDKSQTFEKSQGFEKRPRVYANLSANKSRQQPNLNEYKHKSDIYKMNPYESSQIEQIQEQQRSQRSQIKSNKNQYKFKKPSTIKDNDSEVNPSGLSDQIQKNIAYLQQNDSVVYKQQQQEHFTFSYHQQEKPKKIVKIGTTTDTKAIRTCQYSESARYFALGTNSSYLKIFDIQQLYKKSKVEEEELIPIYQIQDLHLKSIFCLDWSKHERAIITCSNDLTVKITQFGQLFSSHKTTVIGRHQSGIRMCKFNGNQNKIVSCADDGLLKVWDLGKLKKCTNLKGHNGSVSGFRFAQHQDESIIYSVSKDSTIRKWDLRSGQCERTSKVQGSQITYIADHTEKIVVSHKNGTVSFFNSQLIIQHAAQIHQQQIRSLDGLTTNNLLLSASFDGHMSLFNEKNLLSPLYCQHNENDDDKVVFATFLQHPDFNGFASTSTLGFCNLYTYF